MGTPGRFAEGPNINSRFEKCITKIQINGWIKQHDQTDEDEMHKEEEK